MTLTPEQKAEGWIEWNGGDCPIKDVRTRVDVMLRRGVLYLCEPGADWCWGRAFGDSDIIAYRIAVAHGADAEPARPTPWPQSYADLVFDADGWSQTIIVDGKRPEWLRDDDEYTVGISGMVYKWTRYGGSAFAIRVRRREPKRETQRACLRYQTDRPFDTDLYVTIDLIDGKPDLSTLKIAEDAL